MGEKKKLVKKNKKTEEFKPTILKKTKTLTLKEMKPITNARNETKVKNYNLSSNNSRGVTLENINKIYKELIKEYDVADIRIIAKPMTGGFVTLKSNRHSGDDLKYLDEDYFDDRHSEEVRNKLLGRYYEINFHVNV